MEDKNRKIDPVTGKPTGGAYATDDLRDKIDYNAEEEYWRSNYSSRPYYNEGTSFIEYKPAYRYGADAYTKHRGRSWDQAEGEIGRDWDKVKGTSSLTWEKAKLAARDGWERVKNAFERAVPGDSDHDGR
jgi:hypothetical protein